MKRLKSKIINFLMLIVFTILLLTGTNLTADETEKQHVDPEGKARILLDKESDKKSKDKDKELTTFTPTEEVSADQAVAFPSDI